MKKVILLVSTLILLAFSVQANACVGRILNIGIVDSINESLLAELISVLINERTGTTVNVVMFDSTEEIYEAIKKEEVNIVIENTDHAVSMLNAQGSGDKMADYDMSKIAFREKYNLIMLKPFGVLASGTEDKLYSAAVTEDVLINFPALPRVINKLKNISDDKKFTKVLKSVTSGTKVKRVARDFLRKKKLI